IEHIAKQTTQRIFIQRSVSINICIYTWLQIEWIKATEVNRWRTFKCRRQFILYLNFYHTIIDISGSIRRLKHHHDRFTTKIATGKWNTGAKCSSKVVITNRWCSSWQIVYTGTFRRPVEIDTTCHPSSSEGHRTTIVETAIAERMCIDQCNTIRP